MTNKFFDYMQPTIVKTSNHPELPEKMRNRYLINYNVMGIRYFEQYYLLKESKDGIPYLLLKEDQWGVELEESPEEFDKILDIPRLYIDITDKFINGGDLFRTFIFQSIMENSIYSVGIDNFIAGKDYWLNTTLYNYLANSNQIAIPNFAARLPNYLTEIGTITEYFIDLSFSPYKDYTNLVYYEHKNQLLDNKYTEDELKDFYRNFCQIILKQTLINDDLKSSGNNPIYNLVLNYYGNYQSDDASNALGLVLNSLYSTDNTTSSGCSCNSGLNNFLNGSKQSQDIQTKSCSQIYEEAMSLYLKQMLGDKQFYKDWFMIQLTEWESELNDILIEDLLTYCLEFLEMDFCLDFGTLTTKVHSSFCCNHDQKSSDETKNLSIFNNYIKVLNFIQNKQIDENTNKIKIWGETFGELLPSLQF